MKVLAKTRTPKNYIPVRSAQRASIYYALSHPNIIKAYDLISAVLQQTISDSHSVLLKR
ncbi:MAG: hypothetical protein ACE5LV_09300 [Candidatus Aminicenantales bacterium]